MALSLKQKYPGQVITTDPGYPWGKARNVTNPGDGSGTPYEAALVNDIFGFLQHLLAAGNVTPSEDPDKVNASQYFEGLVKAFLKDPRTWADEQTFNDTVVHNGITYLNFTNLINAVEILYTVPRTRKMLVPLTLFAPDPAITFSGPTQWRLNTTLAGQVWFISSCVGGGDGLRGAVKVPAGSTVTEVKAFVSTGAGSTLGLLKVGRHRYDTAGGVGAPSFTVQGLEPVQSPNVSSVLGSGPLTLDIEENDLISIAFDAGDIANGTYINWVEVTYVDHFATGHR